MAAVAGKPAGMTPRAVSVFVWLWFLGLAITYGLLVWIADASFDTYMALWVIFPVGILGAIVANATGTGGGVVFIPVFNALAISAAMFPTNLCNLVQIEPAQAVGISFLIQCFGMSVGSANWLKAFATPGRVKWDEAVSGPTLQYLAFAPLATGVPVLLLTQRLLVVDGGDLITFFKIFSISLGVILLFFTWQQRGIPKSRRRLAPTHRDLWILLLLGALGGAVTAIFSVGIGEFVAVYLILRRFPTTVAIAVAVWVSVVCVLTGVWWNASQGNIVLEIALVAIPGAVVGGFLARGIAVRLGSLWLKTLAAVWIIASSIYLILIKSPTEAVQC